ncbi:MAG TPA: 1,4-dihydroxy-2-naphthoate polyprenyltransferase [Acidimicrobiales bacterium]|nr:1,4-dihydroxy-2-naphthoate polyprenyltransferase [Acidimicrobiales bacterium]
MTSAWVEGARPKTLPAAVVPVAVGTAVAFSQGEVIWWRALAALVVSLAVQIGTNFANDYSDGIRGTDDVRVGPVRLVASGLKPAKAVKRAAFLSFGVAAFAGLALAAVTTWWLIPVGAACFAAGWFYTGGPKPYGYAGLGEVFVFAFFGIVATAGSAFVHVEGVTMLAIGASVPVGALATALLVVNNLRDIPTDTASGKRTLAVRLGDQDTRMLYLVLLTAVPIGAAVLLAVVRPLTLASVLGIVLGVPAARAVRKGARGRDLIPVLVRTGQVQLAYGLLLAAGLAVR